MAEKFMYRHSENSGYEEEHSFLSNCNASRLACIGSEVMNNYELITISTG